MQPLKFNRSIQIHPSILTFIALLIAILVCSPCGAQVPLQQYRAAEAKALEISDRLRGASSQAQRAELESELREAVQMAFALKIKMLKSASQSAQAKVDVAREQIAKREKLADQIIARRVSDLKQRNQTLWDDATGEMLEIAADLPAIAGAGPTEVSPPPTKRLSTYQVFLRNAIAEKNYHRNYRLEAMAECKMNLVELRRDANMAIDESAEDKDRQLQEKMRAEAAIETLTRQIAALQDEVTICDETISLLETKLVATLDSEESVESIGGKVESVAKDRVDVSLGSDNGVQKGTRLKIFRDDLYIGEVEVVDVQRRSSVGVVTDLPTQSIRNDDDAILLLDPQLKDLLRTDPGESLYNDQFRRFKFRLDQGVSTVVGTGVRAMRRYLGDDRNPPIYGMWGDPATNSLVVIAPAESEMAIREFLIKGEVIAKTGFDMRERKTTIEEHAEELSRQRRLMIADMAECKLEMIDCQAQEVPDQKRIASLLKEIAKLKSEIERIDLKISVVDALQGE
ncbi:MAG: hypothetical protein HKN47_07675 [Pirellulaceae bacterium]|nr:hypothetical protein [Pirellulaceae bacterium]